MTTHEWEIAWSENLSVDNPELDYEHRQFILRVNELNKATIECKDKETIKRLMVLMVAEATHHFWHEEQLLAKSKYPDSAVHAHKHAQLIAQLDRTMKEFEKTDLSYVWAVKGLNSKQLLVDHLLKEDMKYRDYFRAKLKSNWPLASVNKLRNHIEITN